MPSSFVAFTDQTRPLTLLDPEPTPPRPSLRASIFGAAGALVGLAAVLVLL